MADIDFHGIAEIIVACTSFGSMLTSALIALRQKQIAKEATVAREELKTIVVNAPNKDGPPL